jgi:hypothetical protein
MTPIPRYLQLNNIMVEQRGGHFKAMIKGLDELQTLHDNVMLEACNTSFHCIIRSARTSSRGSTTCAGRHGAAARGGRELAGAVAHRLWHETRVALFQQSLDTRHEHKVQRGVRQRVSFGDEWVKDSILEIYRDDIARFRSLITAAPTNRRSTCSTAAKCRR